MKKLFFAMAAVVALPLISMTHAASSAKAGCDCATSGVCGCEKCTCGDCSDCTSCCQ